METIIALHIYTHYVVKRQNDTKKDNILTYITRSLFMVMSQIRYQLIHKFEIFF